MGVWVCGVFGVYVVSFCRVCFRFSGFSVTSLSMSVMFWAVIVWKSFSRGRTISPPMSSAPGLRSRLSEAVV